MRPLADGVVISRRVLRKKKFINPAQFCRHLDCFLCQIILIELFEKFWNVSCSSFGGKLAKKTFLPMWSEDKQNQLCDVNKMMAVKIIEEPKS